MIVNTNSDFDFQNLIETAKWDWLRASIVYETDDDRTAIMQEIINYLIENYGDPALDDVSWWHEDLPDNSNYEKVKQFGIGTQKLFTVSRGRPHVGKFVQIDSSGSRASIGRKIIDRISKKLPYEVRATRSDSAIDLAGDPELFNTLTGFFNAYCKKHKIAPEPRGLGWHNPEKGRTMYYGSKSSDYYLRIYEKGHEQRDSGVEDADLTWVRIEVQVQYKQSLQRLAVARWPLPSYGFRIGWIKKAFNDLLMTDLLSASIPSSYKPQTDTEKSIYNMFKRAKKALRLLAMDSPSEQEFTRKILDEINYSFDEVN